MDNTSSLFLGGVVDRLAAVKANIANLQAEKAELEQCLVDSGRMTVDGQLHRAAIVEVLGRTTTDWKSVAQALAPSQYLIDTYTARGDGYTVVRVSARRTS